MTEQTSTFKTGHRMVAYWLAIFTVATLAVFWVITAASADSKGSFPADRDQLLQDLSDGHPAVEEALADGTVSVAEVSEGVARAVSCMEASGVHVVEASFTADGHIRMIYENGSASGADAADEVQARCLDEHAQPLAEAYGVERMPTIAELDSYHNTVLRCLRARGIDAYSAQGVDDVADRKSVRECSAEAEAMVFGR